MCVYANETVLHITQVSTYSFHLPLRFLLLSTYFATYYRVYYIEYTLYTYYKV